MTTYLILGGPVDTSAPSLALNGVVTIAAPHKDAGVSHAQRWCLALLPPIDTQADEDFSHVANATRMLMCLMLHGGFAMQPTSPFPPVGAQR
jgi:hypothetical protein